MAHILFSAYPCDGYYLQQEYLSGNIRLSIFLITEVVVGLPAVVWALRVLYHHHKSGNQVSAFMIALLLSDLLVLLLNPLIVIKLLQNDFCWRNNMTCRVFSSLWAASIIYGAHLQQVVALEGELSLRNLSCSCSLYPSCSSFISIILYVFFLLCEISGATVFILFGLLLILVIILTSWILTCSAPPCISDTPSSDRRPSVTVLAFVPVTGVLCGTLISMCAVMYLVTAGIDCNLFIMCVCLMSLNVIIDPLLCVTVCRKHTIHNKSEVNI